MASKSDTIEAEIIVGISMMAFESGGEWLVDGDRYSLSREKVEGNKIFLTVSDDAGEVWKRFEVSAKTVYVNPNPTMDES